MYCFVSTMAQSSLGNQSRTRVALNQASQRPAGTRSHKLTHRGEDKHSDRETDGFKWVKYVGYSVAAMPLAPANGIKWHSSIQQMAGAGALEYCGGEEGHLQ